MKKETILKHIETSIIRQELSYRGGGIEISLDKLGFKGEKMSVYQNYLGGGMLGSIQENNTKEAYGNPTEKQRDKLAEIAIVFKEYMHNITNHEDDEWESQSFEQNQGMPSSAY